MSAAIGLRDDFTAARIGGMDRQTLRDWAHRFNETGPDGLINIKPTGRRPKLSAEQQEVLRQLVEAGADPEKDGVVRWRCADLQLSLIHISEPTRRTPISYAVFCLKKKI